MSAILRRLFSTDRLRHEAEAAAYILKAHSLSYYLDKRATTLNLWGLDDGRALLRIPRLCGLSATYYIWDGAALLPLSTED
jgi:hypothetical protein